jgi:hypothetical protein
MLSQGSMKDRGEFLGAICHKSRALCYSSAGHDDTRSRTFSTRHGDTQSQRFASSAGQGDVLAGGGKRTATSKSWAQGRASACDLVGVEAERTAPRLPGQQTRSPALGRWGDGLLAALGPPGVGTVGPGAAATRWPSPPVSALILLGGDWRAAAGQGRWPAICCVGEWKKWRRSWVRYMWR